MSLKNQNGDTLIGTLLALACLAVMVTASFSFMLNSKRSTNMMLQVNVREKMTSTMKMVARLPTAIQVSHEGATNEALRDCLDRMQVFDNTIPGDCQGGVQTTFSLYGPMRDTGAGVDALSGELAGTESKPVEYNSMGAAVNKSAGESTVILVRSWFKPQCPPKNFGGAPANVCDVAEAIEFTYEIESNFPETVGGTPKLKKFRESVVYAVTDLGNEKPAIDPEVVPPPPPIPVPVAAAPSALPPAPAPGVGDPTGGKAGGGLVGSVVVVPLAPIKCYGETVQIGPNQCACPPGEKLVSPRKGKCSKVSI